MKTYIHFIIRSLLVFVTETACISAKYRLKTSMKHDRLSRAWFDVSEILIVNLPTYNVSKIDCKTVTKIKGNLKIRIKTFSVFLASIQECHV